jgi:hypothetical protein
MNTQYDYSIYFLDPKDNQVYQYIYADFESANREYNQCIHANYSATLLVSLKSYNRQLDNRIRKTEGNC